MKVTKQEQLEWLAKEFYEWPFSGGFVFVSPSIPMEFASRSGIRITRCEWQHERDKMHKQQDNSWHERGEFPPVGCLCEFRYKYPDRGIYCGWESGTILFLGDELFVVKHGDSERAIDINSREFRPLRTEREKAIDEMVKAITDDRIAPLYVQNIAAKLYDAGFRKGKAK